MGQGGKTILVVDDEQFIRRSMSDFFEDEGFVVLTAESGEDGIEVLREKTVHLCTVDMRLPGMDGNDFILKAHAINPTCRFIIYTGFMDYNLPQEFKAIGISKDHVFQKPIEDLQVLVEVVSSILSG